ncbi:MAG: hypothetical protein SH809_00895 [Rhodothermales bacterium]|nr:hypothetical protein [Rhodothermales bacterium]
MNLIPDRIIVPVTAISVVKVLAGVILLLTVAHVFSMALWWTGQNRLSELLVEKFSFGGEGNIPAFFSAVLLLLASALFGLIGRCARAIDGAKSGHWMALAGVFLFLTLDEAAQIHEKLDTDLIWGSLETSGFLAWPWVILYGGLVAAFFVVFGRFWLGLPATIKWPYAVAAALYVGAALGFEMLEARVYTEAAGPGPLFDILVTIEEFLEMSAILYAIHTSLRYLSQVQPAAFAFVPPEPVTASAMR